MAESAVGARVGAVARWQPDTRGRLQAAATALYAEHGYDRTTIAQIAERAGLTERTFYRHFGDKREVLFGNEESLTDRLAVAVAGAPDGASMREAIAAGLDAIVAELQPRWAELVQREEIVARQPELRERELMKLATWTAALSDALVRRGEDPSSAALSAEVSVTVLRVAAGRWLSADTESDLAERLEFALNDLRVLAT
jgi:AcrR family transcriptional regulator